MTELGKNWSTKIFPLDQSRGGGGRHWCNLYAKRHHYVLTEFYEK